MAVTLQKIADAVQVDRSAVSRVLNGKGRSIGLSEERIRQIEETARRMNYRPNTAARAVKRGSFGNIALLSGTVKDRSSLHPGLLDRIHDRLAGHNLSLTLAKLPDEKLIEDGVVPRILRESFADGMLINYTHAAPSGMVSLVEELNLPVVWLNTRHEHDCVHPDDFNSVRLATEALLRRGHRRVAFWDLVHRRAAIHHAHYSVSDRLLGYESTMKDAGLASDVVFRDDVGPAEGDRIPIVRDLMQRDDRPTAVITYGFGTTVAWGVRDAGLNIPGDVTVVALDAVASRSLPIHVVEPDLDRMADAVVDLLMRRMRDDSHPAEPVVVPFHFHAPPGDTPLGPVPVPVKP